MTVEIHRSRWSSMSLVDPDGSLLNLASSRTMAMKTARGWLEPGDMTSGPCVELNISGYILDVSSGGVVLAISAVKILYRRIARSLN